MPMRRGSAPSGPSATERARRNSVAYHFASARDLFEAARDAARDAETCRRQLDRMERKALRVASPSFEARVHGGNHDHIGGDVAALVDRETELQGRIDSDYDLIDAACAILYGRDGMSDGLASIAPPWWADAIFHHFLALRPWVEVAGLMGIGRSRLQSGARAAFDLMDATGMAATVEGRGDAEG